MQLAGTTLRMMVLSVLISLSNCASAELTACGWVPGDAFFAASGFRVEGDAENAALVFADVSLQNTPGFRNYRGFHFLKVNGNVALLAAALESLPQPRGDRLFLVYNKAFVHGGGRFGLKYNERWHKPPQQAQTARKSFPAVGIYTALVQDAEAVQSDWRMSERFDGLSAVVPASVTDWARPGELIRTPAEIPVQQVTVVVVRKADIGRLYRKRETARAWLVESSGAILTLRYEKGQRKLAVAANPREDAGGPPRTNPR